MGILSGRGYIGWGFHARVFEPDAREERDASEGWSHRRALDRGGRRRCNYERIDPDRDAVTSAVTFAVGGRR